VGLGWYGGGNSSTSLVVGKFYITFINTILRIEHLSTIVNTYQHL